MPRVAVWLVVAVAALEGAEDLCGTVERLAHAVSRQHGGDDGMVCVWVEVVVLEVSPFVGAGVGVPVARPVYASGLVVGAPRKHVLDVVASFRVVCSDLDAGGEAARGVDRARDDGLGVLGGEAPHVRHGGVEGVDDRGRDLQRQVLGGVVLVGDRHDRGVGGAEHVVAVDQE